MATLKVLWGFSGAEGGAGEPQHRSCRHKGLQARSRNLAHTIAPLLRPPAAATHHAQLAEVALERGGAALRHLGALWRLGVSHGGHVPQIISAPARRRAQPPCCPSARTTDALAKSCGLPQKLAGQRARAHEPAGNQRA